MYYTWSSSFELWKKCLELFWEIIFISKCSMEIPWNIQKHTTFHHLPSWFPPSRFPCCGSVPIPSHAVLILWPISMPWSEPIAVAVLISIQFPWLIVPSWFPSLSYYRYHSSCFLLLTYYCHNFCFCPCSPIQLSRPLLIKRPQKLRERLISHTKFCKSLQHSTLR